MNITDSDLSAYLDEALPDEQMAWIEQSLREDTELARRLAALIGRRDAGMHSVGDIWRRRRLSCPNRQQIADYLAGRLSKEETEYIRFHLTVVGCQVCQANHDDLKAKQPASDADISDEETNRRRRKYFQSSVGYLRRDEEEL